MSAPRLVRVVGPHAEAVCAALVGPEVLAAIPHGSVPEGPARIWLHDAPGSRSQADLLVAWATLFDCPWTVVLSGRSTDGGHPMLVETLSADAPPGTAGCSEPDAPRPTQVLLPGPSTRQAVFMALGRGELLLAHAHAEVLGFRDLGWLELTRLVGTARSSEVLARAAALKLEPSDRAWLPMGEAMVQQGRIRHARLLLDAAARSDDPALGADARMIRYVISDEVGAGRDAPRPGSPYLVETWKALRSPGTMQPRATPGSALVEAPYHRGDPRAGVEDGLRCGRFTEATMVARRLFPGHRANDILLDDRIRNLLKQVSRALRHDLDEARRLLDSVEPEVASTPLYRRALEGRRFILAALADDHARARALAPLTGEILSLIREVGSWRSVAEMTRTAKPLMRARVLGLLLASGGPVELRPALLQELGVLGDPILLDEYVLDAPLGEGGMGTVWSAHHTTLELSVAVKVLRRQQDHDRWLQTFRHEVDLTTRLEHPAIVAVLDFGTVSLAAEAQSQRRLVAGDPYLVMEQVQGGTLADRLGELDWPALRAVGVALLDALAYAHSRGVLHRDLKPANVLVTPDHRIRLTDFGLAGLTDTIAGTPSYMAPEQFSGQTSPASDLYALGCLLWALATGMPPYLGTVEMLQTAHQSAPLPGFEPWHPMPTGLQPFLARCLAKAPRQRFASAWEARRALLAVDGDLVEGRPLPPPPVDPDATFVLEDLLPGETLALESAPTTVTRLGPAPVRTAFRARAPTANLLRRGDPEPIGHPMARHLLLGALGEALERGERRGVHLAGPAGVGKRELITWVRRQALVQGVPVADAPDAGAAVLHLEAHPDAWTRAEGRPWLIVSTGPEAPEGFATVQLQTLSVMELYFVARSRLPASPSTIASAVQRAAGRPALLLRLLEGWRAFPGFVESPEGLALAGEIPDRNVPAQAWWAEQLATLDAPTRAGLQLAATLQSPFQRSTWERVRGDTALGWPASMLQEDDDGFRVSPELRLQLDSRPSSAWHARAASVEHDEPDGAHRRAVHRILAGNPEAVTALLPSIRTSLLFLHPRRPTLETLRAFEHGLLLTPSADPTAVQWLQIARLRDHHTSESEHAAVTLATLADEALAAGDVEQAFAAAFTLALRSDRGSVDRDPRRDRIRLEALWERAESERLRAWVALAWLLADGNPNPTWESRVEERGQAANDRLVRVMLRIHQAARLEHDAEELARLTNEAVLLMPPAPYRSQLLANQAHISLLGGHPARALEQAELAVSAGHAVPFAWSALALAHVALGHDLDAAYTAVEAAYRFLLSGHRGGAGDMFLLGLALAPAWPDEHWEDVASVVPALLAHPRGRDPWVAELLATTIGRMPAGHRRTLLERLLRTGAPGTPDN